MNMIILVKIYPGYLAKMDGLVGHLLFTILQRTVIMFLEKGKDKVIKSGKFNLKRTILKF